MQRYFVNASGSYLGSYFGPDESIPADLLGQQEVPAPPDDGRQIWNGVEWLPLDVALDFTPVSRRKLRLTLVRNDIPLSRIDALISALPEGREKDEAKIEWEDATEFDRDHPTLLLIALALNLSKERVDEMWREAMAA
ncbi:hypothetical protein [uncultured Agrobacterium sp.]|uniref:hypothetical protein n=1 Tax=uncultured Agrobacterium sp. TaxID=157277 RepID=UPI0025F6B0FD|nr:hypothetical protein [uncultured Agrobacterium sp.]